MFKENILLNLPFLFSNNNPKNKLMMKKTLLILVTFTAINTAFAQRVVNSNQKQQTTQSTLKNLKMLMLQLTLNLRLLIMELLKTNQMELESLFLLITVPIH